jgi:hypothetical protein
MDSAARSISRRDVLTKGIIAGGVGAAAGMLVTSGSGCAQAQGTSKLTLDVACLGDTLRIQPTDGNAEGDLRGNTFYVEGAIYERGTITRTGFDPKSGDPIGVWLCRGWFMINKDRAEPHVLTTQEYLLGNIRKTQLFPADQLVSSGMEGTETEKEPPVRSIIGGTGRYAGATGVVLQHGNGRNTTTLRGIGQKAPNVRFEFRLLVPEIDLSDLGRDDA